MLTFGPISSIFDLLTFVLLYFIFRVPEAFFQTGWFMESLATQTFVIFIIRTRKTPFLESRPSRYLLLSSLICVCLGWILPYTPVGKFFGFVSPPAMIVFVIIGIVVMYLLIVEAAKDIFYKKHDF
jgi:Mg2+-importing ATPase